MKGDLKMFASAAHRGMINTKGFLFTAVMFLSLFTSLTAEAALSLLSQPANSTVYEGKSISFTVSATSNRTIRYSWYKNGVQLSNKTKTLSISNAILDNAGTYSCVVNDGRTKISCKPFTLTVNEIVRITAQPSNQMVDAGSSAKLTVAATGAAPLSYQWYYNGSAISGATASSLTYTSTTTANSGNYYCIVKNPGSSATSSTAALQIVAVVKSGSAQISWSTPTTRQDGTALTATEIAGYNLYHSATSTSSLSKLASLTPSELSIVVSDLAAGTHYFALSTIDKNGLLSSLSSAISVTIQ